MKALRKHCNIFILFILCLIISACETKKTELHSKSNDGSASITVYGNKTVMEPWDLTIEIKKDNKSDKLNTQLYADEINTNNVSMIWQDDNSCIITLTDRDGTQRILKIGI